MIKKHLRRSLFICISATLLTLLLFMFGAFDHLENSSIDFRFRFRGDRPTDKAIVIVAVDEPSIRELGRWPWPRRTHARLIRIMGQAGARVVAFDSLFTEVDKANPESDQALADAARDTDIVVSAFFFEGGIQGVVNGVSPTLPYQSLLEASHLGFVNLEPDHDGVTRRVKLYGVNQDAAFPSLAAATYALSQGKAFNEVIDELPIVVSKDPYVAENELVVNFALPPPYNEPYPVYSFLEVLDGTIPAETFKDKIVLVGATAAGLYDLKAIPFVSKYPGVGIHANVVDNLIHRNWIKPLPSEVTAAAILIVGFLLGFFLPRLSPWGKLGAFVGVLGSFLLISLWLFSSKQIIIGTVAPAMAAILSYIGTMFYRLLIEEKEKRKIKGSFKQYLSPKIIDVITKDPEKLKLGGEEREVTVFFLDIAGFTTMSEALKPTQLVEVMNQCLTEFSSTILKHEGLINKYIGDCIMAFWNAPAEQPKHATMACRAALDCIAALPDLNKRFRERGLPSIDCRIGINTGVVVVGNMGSNERFDYTVMGDPVNLASRLEGANKQYHTHIMISETTFELAKEDVESRDIDLIRVKGKKEPRKVFELICEKSKMTEEWNNGRRIYHDALRLYRNRQFEEAIHTFQEVFDYLPNDHLTRVYLERSRQFQINPPPSAWDGVYEMKTK